MAAPLGAGDAGDAGDAEDAGDAGDVAQDQLCYILCSAW